MIKYYFSILFFSLGAVLLAQQTEGEKSIYQMFDNPSKIKWVKHYKGRMDDLNDVTVSLAFDGSKCKGRMQYLRSKTEFKLEGTLTGSEIKLLEIDNRNEVTGFVRGNLNSGKVIARWLNYDGSIEGHMRLEQTKKAAKFPSYCGDNKWIRHYRGGTFRKRVDILVQKDNEDFFHGIVFFEKEEKSFELKFKNKEDDLLVFDLINPIGQSVGTIKGAFQIQDKVAATYIDESGYQEFINCTINEALPVGCVEYADYMMSYDITYPKIKHNAFDSWIEKMSNDWVNSCKDYSKKIKNQNPNQKPALRAAVRAFAWCDLEHYSNQLISGYINFNSTWSDRQQGKVFNFDLKRNKEIRLEDIFREDFDFKKFIKTYINNEVSKHPLYRDLDYRKWLRNQDFSFFTIRNEGLSFATQFSTIYGQQKVTIPFWKLKPYVKRNSPIEHLLR